MGDIDFPSLPPKPAPPPPIPPAQREEIACAECRCVLWEWVPVTRFFRDRLARANVMAENPPNGSWSVRCARCLAPLPVPQEKVNKP